MVWQQTIQDVYGYRSCQLPPSIREATPAFLVNSWIYGQKVTNMPFNFFPELLEPSSDTLASVLGFWADYCRDHPGVYGELKLIKQLPSGVPSRSNWRVSQPFIRSYLQLTSNPKTTYAKAGRNLHSNLNRIRNKLARSNIQIVLATTHTEIVGFYRLLARIYRDRHQMVCHPLLLYETLFDRQLADFYLAIDQSKVIGGIVVLRDSQKYYYSWGATEPSYLPLGISMALLDRAIQDAIVAGAVEFDFGTSSPADEKLLEFKRRWGCQTAPTFFYHYGRQKMEMPDLYSGYHILRQFYRLLPVSMIQRLMPLVVPHLG